MKIDFYEELNRIDYRIVILVALISSFLAYKVIPYIEPLILKIPSLSLLLLPIIRK